MNINNTLDVTGETHLAKAGGLTQMHGNVDIADPVFHLEDLFAGGTDPRCDDACDTNDDGLTDIADPIYTLDHLFNMGPDPLPPFGFCGNDPTPDVLDCANFGACP